MAERSAPSRRRGLEPLRAALRPLAVAAGALALFAGILLLAGKDPLQACMDTLASSLGSAYGLSELVVRAIPLLLTATAVALPSRLGLVNVGGEGQLYMGAWLASAGALFLPPMPAALAVPVAAVLGFTGGALWAAIPGVLRGLRLVDETISTLLLNYVAPLLVSWCLYGPWRSAESSAYPQSPAFPDATLLPTYFGTAIHAGSILAAAALLLYWLVVERSRWGLALRAIGGNAEAAERAGIPVARWTAVALAVGGGLAGLAGMAEVLGVHGRLRQELSPGYGFTGFLVSWLAGGRPVPILLGSLLLAFVTDAGYTLQITQHVPHAVVNVLLAAVLFIVLARGQDRRAAR